MWPPHHLVGTNEDCTQRAVCRVRVRGNSGKITELSIVLDGKNLSPLNEIVFDSHDASLVKAAKLCNVTLAVQIAKKVGTKMGHKSYVWQYFEKLVIPQIKVNSKKNHVYPCRKLQVPPLRSGPEQGVGGPSVRGPGQK